MIKTLTNNDISMIINNYENYFKKADIVLPVRANFYIKKNINTLNKLYEDIDAVRMEIIKKYGTMSKEGDRYNFTDEGMNEANKELSELYSIKQDVDINLIDLDLFDNVNLTTGQMDAILFMIKE